MVGMVAGIRKAMNSAVIAFTVRFRLWAQKALTSTNFPVCAKKPEDDRKSTLLGVDFFSPLNTPNNIQQKFTIFIW